MLQLFGQQSLVKLKTTKKIMEKNKSEKYVCKINLKNNLAKKSKLIFLAKETDWNNC